MLLIGENNKIRSTYKAMERFEKAAPISERDMFTGAGYYLLAVKTELVNARILELLDSVETGSQ